jgi:hypothetical protein
VSRCAGYRFYYPSQAIGWEVAMLFLLGILDSCRLYLGERSKDRESIPSRPSLLTAYRVAASKGNKTEQIPPLVWSLTLDPPIIVGYSYYLDLQTYV